MSLVSSIYFEIQQLLTFVTITDITLRRGFRKIKLQNFGHMFKFGLPYLPSTLVWTETSLDKYSYCLPYLPIQKVWTFSNFKRF